MELKERLEQLIKEWHESRRAGFDARFKSLGYDTYAPKTLKEKTKYFYLDSGNSGVYIAEKSTGLVYGIKGYGVINRRRCYGNAFEITGKDLTYYC